METLTFTSVLHGKAVTVTRRLSERERHVRNYAAVEKLYASGMRDRQIAETLGIPLKDARYIRKKLGLASHDSRTSNRYPDLPAQVRALHARSWSDGDIARLSGAHRSTVSRIRRGLGLPPHMRWGLSREQYRRWLDGRR
jgi:hypothetical protein